MGMGWGVTLLWPAKCRSVGGGRNGAPGLLRRPAAAAWVRLRPTNAYGLSLAPQRTGGRSRKAAAPPFSPLPM